MCANDFFSRYYDPTSDPLPCKSVEEENSEIELKCIYIIYHFLRSSYLHNAM